MERLDEVWKRTPRAARIEWLRRAMARKQWAGYVAEAESAAPILIDGVGNE